MCAQLNVMWQQLLFPTSFQKPQIVLGFGQCVLPSKHSQPEVSVIPQIVQLHFIQHKGLIESHRPRKINYFEHNTQFGPKMLSQVSQKGLQGNFMSFLQYNHPLQLEMIQVLNCKIEYIQC